MGGYRYGIILVDVTTRYCWFYGPKSTMPNKIINTLSQFRADIGHLPCRFHSNFDRKLMGGKCLRWINNDKSKITAAPAKRQSANGLVERTWRTLVQMYRAYLTKKQTPQEYWYWSILHGYRMLKHVPGHLNSKLTYPFELVHVTKPDPRTWFELFSLGFFHHQADGTVTQSKT